MIGADELAAHLTACRIAGPVARRERVLRHCARFAHGDPELLLGLDPEHRWPAGRLLALLAARCGVSPDPAYRHGPDTLDPELTVRALDALAAVLAATAAAGGTVLTGTGHPGPLLGFYAAIALALREAGCVVRTPACGSVFQAHAPEGARRYILDFERRVGVVRVYEEMPANGAHYSGGPGADPLPGAVHTHSPQPVRIALAALAAAGHTRPDLVIGDHGWVCGAARLGVAAVGLADADDPALFVAEAEGRVAVAVPLDDGARPECYGLLTAYVLQQAGMSQ